MRVLFLYPWGCFYPPTSGAEYVACNQLDYFRSRGFEVHCVLCKVLGQVPGDVSRLIERFPCIRTIRVLDVQARKLTLRDLLFGFDRAAASAEFRALAREPFDLFFTNYVMSAPFACALPLSVYKIVETLDLLAGMFRTLNLLSQANPTSEAIQAVERQFVFERIELDLYRAFDRALMISNSEAQAVQSAGYPGAVYVPQPFPVPARRAKRRGSLYDLVFVGSENQLNARGIGWFYRNIYVPYLRRRRVHLAIAGRVCQTLDFVDSSVHAIGYLDELEPLYDDTKLVINPIFEGTGVSIKLHEALAAGRAVVSTPIGCRGIDPASGAILCLDMKRRPRQAAERILDLLADDQKRGAMQDKAVELMTRLHSPQAYVRAMDSILRGASPNQLRSVA
jgi:glycosyltransferase involved in cell wall biosynthesis